MIPPNDYAEAASHLFATTGGAGLILCWANKTPRHHTKSAERQALPRPVYFHLPPVPWHFYRYHVNAFITPPHTLPKRVKDDQTGLWATIDTKAGDIAFVPLKWRLCIIDIDEGSPDAVIRKIGMHPIIKYRSSLNGGTHLLYPIADIAGALARGQPIWEFIDEDGTLCKGDIRLGAGYARLPGHHPEILIKVADIIRQAAETGYTPALSIDAINRLAPPPQAPTPEEITQRQTRSAALAAEYESIPSPETQLAMIVEYYGLRPDSSVGYRGFCPLCQNPRADTLTANIGSRGGVMVGCFSCQPDHRQRIDLIHAAVPMPKRKEDSIAIDRSGTKRGSNIIGARLIGN